MHGKGGITVNSVGKKKMVFKKKCVLNIEKF